MTQTRHSASRTTRTAKKRNEPIDSRMTEDALDSQAENEHVADETDGEMLDDQIEPEQTKSSKQAG